MSQSAITDRVLMIKPRCFGFNEQTAVDNHFQQSGAQISSDKAKEIAIKEFDGVVTTLRDVGIEVNVEDDLEDTSLPDSVFPNNWVSFHPNLLVLYPMKAELRRRERRPDLVKKWRHKLACSVLDISGFEEEGEFLEGTGSLVLDRSNRLAYTCLSARTNPALVNHFCQVFNYKPVMFSASTKDGPIYHTNVMMSVGDNIAIICFETIRDPQERNAVQKELESSGRTIVTITEEQVSELLGNVLQLSNNEGKKFLVMSTRAYRSLESKQKELIEECCMIVHTPIDTIEILGGGGIRCMIAEIFPPLK